MTLRMTLLEVIERIAPELEQNRHIHAMWLEGSWATGKNSEHSDIDVWLDDGTFEQCVADFRRHLTTVGEIDWEDTRGVYSRDPMLMKQTFHPKGFPDDQVVELDLQEHSRQFVFSKAEHIIKVLFDKDGTIQWRP